ncbi:MAG TPA: DUF3891 family protein [Xanthobacteraceae bacterium]
MIVQTAPAGRPRLAVMMHEHTALSGQLARAFGNERFEPVSPSDLMFHVVSHHDAGWAEFDRDPATDGKTGLPYNLVETPAEHITVTSSRSPDFNERQHPYCGLISSMHSWGLYNGRYGLSDMVLIKLIPAPDRALADWMLAGEISRQERLRAELARDPQAAAWLDQRHLFQNYKQLQFFDLLALYFNRIHPDARAEQTFAHVPRNAGEDVTVTVRPCGPDTYELSPYPFAASSAEFAYAGRRIEPRRETAGWMSILREAPTEWETFRLVAGRS